MQERVERGRHYPWRVLVCCALLNRTGRGQVRPVFASLFGAYKTPAEMAFEDPDRLAEILRPLGFQNRRSALLVRLSKDYDSGVPPDRCHGVGQYARDALAIFVEGRTDLSPADHFLRPYLNWKKKHGNS